MSLGQPSDREGAVAPEQHPAQRFETGNAAFNLVLNGGIIRNALYVVCGPPGAGKTILAQQLAFTVASADRRVIYFTNVSEPHSKLMEHLGNFGFYKPDLLGEQVQLYNMTSQIRSFSLVDTLDFIVETVRKERAQLVVIDSFRGLKHVLTVTPSDRAAIFDMAAKLSLLDCTTVLVGEYTPEEMQTEPEFAIADGIIVLRHDTDGVQERRSIRVLKLRGSSYLTGEHSFEITSAGLLVYPRQESLPLPQQRRRSANNQRLSFGVTGLDEMLDGGVPRTSTTLIVGSAGTGKTLLSLSFLANGAAHGERGLHISFQETPDQLRRHTSHLSIDRDLRRRGKIEILSLSAVELSVDKAMAQIRQTVERHRPQRVVLDSLGALEQALQGTGRFDDLLFALSTYLRAQNITFILSREIASLFSTSLSISNQGLSYFVDNIILLRYVELSGEIRRALATLKLRGSDHDHHLRELIIQNGALRIGNAYSGLSGILMGIARPIQQSEE